VRIRPLARFPRCADYHLSPAEGDRKPELVVVANVGCLEVRASIPRSALIAVENVSGPGEHSCSIGWVVDAAARVPGSAHEQAVVVQSHIVPEKHWETAAARRKTVLE